MSEGHEHPEAAKAREFFASIQDENGVDLTLIRENLRAEPAHRLRRVEAAREDTERLRSLRHGRVSRHKPSAVERIARVLQIHGVEFVLIGGWAEVLHNGNSTAWDVDLCQERTSGNLERLARALADLDARPRDGGADASPTELAGHPHMVLWTEFGALDFHAWVEPIGAYRDLLPLSIRVRLADGDVRVLGRDGLLRVRRHLDRPRDRAGIERLVSLADHEAA